MIEGINPALASAPVASGVVAQSSVDNTTSALDSAAESIRSSQPPFLSSVVAIDAELNAAVLQIRDSETGDVIRTIPSDAQIQAYQRSLDGGAAVGYVPITLRDEVAAAQSQAAESAPLVRTESDVDAPSQPQVDQAQAPEVSQEVVSQQQSAPVAASAPQVSAQAGSASTAVNVVV